MIQYPETFKAPDHTAYTGSTQYGLERTTIPTAVANQLKYYNRPITQLSLTFSMTNAEWPEWIQWMRDHSLSWFAIPLVTPLAPVDIVSNHQVRFTGQYVYEKRGDNWLSVTIVVEMLQGDDDDDKAQLLDSEWIIAGTPDTPSTDWLLAGTPATPSTDWVRAELYYY